MYEEITKASDSNSVNSINGAVAKCFKKYATFKGRANRPEYWYFSLFIIVVMLLLMVLDSFLFVAPAGTWTSDLWVVGTFIPSFAVGVRRLHDTNRTGWWMLIGLIPVVGTILLLFMLAKKGADSENRFG
jgi:uncharacterized membrane protein YhaH (DUF805 family)